ncbi:uncharacterized protein KZ484_006594 isoform 1-T2 [Pholidichthys leucotaenia]
MSHQWAEGHGQGQDECRAAIGGVADQAFTAEEEDVAAQLQGTTVHPHQEPTGILRWMGREEVQTGLHRREPHQVCGDSEERRRDHPLPEQIPLPGGLRHKHPLHLCSESQQQNPLGPEPQRRDHTKSGALGEVSPAVLTGWHVALRWPDRKTGDGLQGVQPASRDGTFVRCISCPLHSTITVPNIKKGKSSNAAEENLYPRFLERRLKMRGVGPLLWLPQSSEDDEEEEVMVALYDFPAMEPQNLSLLKGEEYVILEKCDINWYKARNKYNTPFRKILAEKWLHNLGTGHTLKTFPFGRNSVVCEDHFEASCYEGELQAKLLGYKGRLRLKSDAVPSLFAHRPGKPASGRQDRLEKRHNHKWVQSVLQDKPNATATQSSPPPSTELMDCTDQNTSSADPVYQDNVCHAEVQTDPVQVFDEGENVIVVPL